MGEHADRFIAAYNKIERYLERLVEKASGGAFHRGFPELVRKASDFSAVVRANELDLREFGELRNAIVHGNTDPGVVIAEPHDEAVMLIERIASELTEPEKVIPRFAKDVVYVKPGETLSRILSLVYRHRYTQFPVYETGRGISGLVTYTGIVNWLAQNYREPSFHSLDVTARELLRFEDPQDNFRVVGQDADVYEVKEVFARNIDRASQKVNAVIVTRDGTRHAPLLGIITPSDIVGVI
ncbi:MAG: CBS domain-containing protein [Bacillota bacterium]|nr:CBS domain-containing protein [Bacillota bacterium]